MKWSSPAMQRHSALAEYLSELGLEAGGEPRKAVPEALRHGKRTVPLDPWERAVLQDSYGTGSGTPAPYASLIAEGLAFWVKCEELLSSTKAPKPATDSATQSQPAGEKAEELARELMQEAEAELEPLILDTAVGLALMEETQRAVNALVMASKSSDAKKLTAFRNRIAQCVKKLEELIGADAYARAVNKAEAMVPPAGEVAAPDSLTLDARGSKSPWNTGPAAKGESIVVEEHASKVKVLGTLLGASLLVWAIFVMPRFLEEQPLVLERPAFSHIEGVASINARPPSVFITVDTETWDSLEAPDRELMLAEIGTVAEAAGYNGADVRKTDGAVVGRWLRSSGARLVDSAP